MHDFLGFLKRHIGAVDDFVFNRLDVCRFYALCFAYAVAVYGVWIAPPMNYAVSKNPFVNIFINAPRFQFIYDSIVIPLLTYFTGLNATKGLFSLFSLALILGGNMLLVYRTKRRLGSDAAKVVMICFLLSPVSVVLLMWLGHSDSMTYLLQCLLFFSGSALGNLLIGFVGGMNHFPVMLISGIGLLGFRNVTGDQRSGRWQIAGYLSGLGGGYAALQAYQQHYHLAVRYGRLGYPELMGAKQIALGVLENWLAALFSLYNVLWIVVLLSAFCLYRLNRRAFWYLAGINGVFLAASVPVLDTTRVFSLLSWPLLTWSVLLVLGWERNEGAANYGELRCFLSAVLIVGLLIPRLWMFHGSIFFSHFWEMGEGAITELLSAMKSHP